MWKRRRIRRNAALRVQSLSSSALAAEHQHGTESTEERCGRLGDKEETRPGPRGDAADAHFVNRTLEVIGRGSAIFIAQSKNGARQSDRLSSSPSRAGSLRWCWHRPWFNKIEVIRVSFSSIVGSRNVKPLVGNEGICTSVRDRWLPLCHLPPQC